LFTATTRERLLGAIRAEQDALRASPGAGEGRAAAAVPAAPARSTVSRAAPVPVPPDLDLHVLRNVPLNHIYPYVNLQMLLGKHLGIRGSVARLLAAGDAKAVELHGTVAELQREVAEQSLVRADGLYRFYRAGASGNDLMLYDDGREIARFRFPRQRGAERLCLADYARDVEGGEADYVAPLAVPFGAGVP